MERAWRFVTKAARASRYRGAFDSLMVAMDYGRDHMAIDYQDHVKSLLALSLKALGREPVVAA
jgi:hypothetical protein